MLWSLALCFPVLPHPAQAALEVGATRVIYAEDARSRSLLVANVGEGTSALQIWVSDDAAAAVLASPHKTSSAFVTVPAVVLLKTGERKHTQIIYNGKALPGDRESLFWLNVLEVAAQPAHPERPPTDGDAQVNVAVNLQLKLFYRPASLKREMTPLPQMARFALDVDAPTGRRTLKAVNSGAFHLSFASLTVLGAHDQRWRIEADDLMLRPFSERVFELPQTASQAAEPQSIEAQWIDDAGHHHAHSYPLR